MYFLKGYHDKYNYSSTSSSVKISHTKVIIILLQKKDYDYYKNSTRRKKTT